MDDLFDIDAILGRAQKAYGVKNQAQLSKAMNLSNGGVVHGWRMRKQIPKNRLSQICIETGVDSNFLIFGEKKEAEIEEELQETSKLTTSIDQDEVHLAFETALLVAKNTKNGIKALEKSLKNWVEIAVLLDK